MISPQRRLSDFPGRPGRSTSRGRQCLLLDVLQRVVQRPLLSDQAFDGDHLDNLILGPHGKLALLCPYLQQDPPPSQLWAKVLGRQVPIHAAVSAHLPQIHFLIERVQPRIRVHTLGKSG